MNKDYIKESFLSDIKAGFITAIVALPLAIAFAIASGVSPIMGIYTAIIAGILGSAFGLNAAVASVEVLHHILFGHGVGLNVGPRLAVFLQCLVKHRLPVFHFLFPLFVSNRAA